MFGAVEKFKYIGIYRVSIIGIVFRVRIDAIAI